MTLNFALQVIVILAIISAAVAYIGNYVGRYFGKKRLSLFGLRPRSTATIFTLFSGILIAAITFSVVVFVSRDARVAIFGLERLRAEIRTQRNELNSTQEEAKKVLQELEKSKKQLVDSRKEIDKLNAAREKLRKQMDVVVSRQVIFMAGEDVYVSKVTGGKGSKYAEDALQDILNQVDSDMKKYRINEIEIDRGDFNSTVSYLANFKAEHVVRLVALKNTNVGGILPAKFEVEQNKLIFKKGEELLREEISYRLSLSEIEEKLKTLLNQANYLAKSKGVISQSTEIPYAEILNTAKRIKGSATLVTVKLLSEKDVYTIGPLEVEFRTDK